VIDEWQIRNDHEEIIQRDLRHSRWRREPTVKKRTGQRFIERRGRSVDED
jgi:hypothetical protein